MTIRTAYTKLGRLFAARLDVLHMCSPAEAMRVLKELGLAGKEHRVLLSIWLRTVGSGTLARELKKNKFDLRRER